MLILTVQRKLELLKRLQDTTNKLLPPIVWLIAANQPQGKLNCRNKVKETMKSSCNGLGNLDRVTVF